MLVSEFILSFIVFNIPYMLYTDFIISDLTIIFFQLLYIIICKHLQCPMC